ncbi:MAG: fused MFS/spermidine synthase [Coxiellaceae bacterium]|nr:fused MFS/spermidine synthase [Coxiellaceae bacterium]
MLSDTEEIVSKEKTTTSHSNDLTLYLIIFLEGYASIAFEILVIRQLLPFVGGSVIITSFIIGIFLLFLALGYYRGGLYTKKIRSRLQRNFSIACVTLGIGISIGFLTFFFSISNNAFNTNVVWILILYLLLIVAPVAYLLGQTLPMAMTLLMRNDTSGKVGGKVLAASTVGAFFGAVLTTVLLMNTIGVAWTVFINATLLATLSVLIDKKYFTQIPLMCFFLIPIYMLNISTESKALSQTNAYANYLIAEVPNKKLKLFTANRNLSSELYANKKGTYYIEAIKKILFHQLNYHNKNILVLGAGGFTLTAEKTNNNHFTYVDIDKNLTRIAVPRFQKQIHGQFIGQDARSYINNNDNQYDAIILDTYRSLTSIPSYLLTIKFFQDINKHLAKHGVALINVIANPMLNDSFSKQVDNTIRTAFSSCMSIPNSYHNSFTNIIYACQKNKLTRDHSIYSDNKNTSSIDYFISRGKSVAKTLANA